MDFNQFKVKLAALEADEDLRKLLMKHGLEFSHARKSVGCSYRSGEEQHTIKIGVRAIETSQKPEDEQPYNRDLENFKHYAPEVGLSAQDLNYVFTIKGQKFRIVGFNTSKRKNCIKLRRLGDNLPFMCPPETIFAAKKEEGVA